MRPIVRPLVVLAAGALTGISGGTAAHFTLPEYPIARGVFIGEQQIPAGTDAATWLAARRDEARTRKVVLGHGDKRFETTLGALGVEIDVEATLERAREVGHHGSVFTRLAETRQARRGAIDVPLVWRFERDRARAFLETIAPEVRREPVDARLDLANRAKVPEQPGEELSLEATIRAIEDARHVEEEWIPLVMRPIPARVALDDLVEVDLEKVLSSHETIFATFGSGVGRSVNIANAASKIDGVIIPPGEVFSFNEVVGPRTREAGFTLAPEIMGDETTPGIGGGTCQVSSTLHAAALFGALEIIERQSHSRPSAYIQMGLDATVSYGQVDLKIRNTREVPIMIRAYIPEPTPALVKAMSRAIRVELLGADPVAKVEYRYGIARAEDFTRRIYTKSFLPPGKRIRHQKGSRGYDVTSFAKVMFFDGRVEERSWFSGYRPAPEIFWVAPGYNLEELPPMPAHAKGIDDRTTRTVAAM